MLHRYPLVCLSIIISVTRSQRPLVSRVPGNSIEPEGRWVWGRLLGGFVYNAKTSFGGGGGSAAGHTRCGAEVMCGILVSGGGAVSSAGNRGRAGPENNCSNLSIPAYNFTLKHWGKFFELKVQTAKLLRR